MSYKNFAKSRLKSLNILKSLLLKQVILCIFCFGFSFSQDVLAQTHKELLKALDTNVSKENVTKNHWYPSYHFTSSGNGIIDVAALGYFKDNYHMFYQQTVKQDDKVYKTWRHVQSSNLINWHPLPSALTQYEYYDKNDISGGSTIVDGEGEEKLFYILYTGKGSDTKPVDEANSSGSETSKQSKIISTQNLAISKDGFNFGRSANNPVIKQTVLKNSHEFSSEHFVNPYIWKNNDKFYALVGTQYTKTKDGAVLLYTSKDMRNWDIVNVSAIGQKGEMGYLWESPALFSSNGFDVLTISAKGIKPHGKLFLNKNQSGAFVGKLDYNTGKFTQKGAFMLYDYGFDFYAPKFVKTPDGRIICIGLLGMEGTDKSESKDNWAGLTAIPREIKIVNGKLHTIPAKELENLRSEHISIHPVNFNDEKEFTSIKGSVYELETTVDLTNSDKFSIKLRYDISNELVLSYDKSTQILKLNRNKAGGSLTGEREVLLPLYENKLHLRIFSDQSSVEIFANNGQAAMSTRVYPEKTATGIKFVSEGETKIEKLNLYKLKSKE